VGIPSLILANEWELRHLCPKRQLDVEKKNGGKPAQCQFSIWVRPGKRTPPSAKFPLGNSGKSSFSGDLVGSVFRAQAKWQIATAQKIAKNMSFFGT